MLSSDKKFQRFLVAANCFFMFLIGFGGGSFVVSYFVYAPTKAKLILAMEEFAEYKDEVVGYEHFVDYYPTCDTMVVNLDSTSSPYLFDLSDFVKWQKGISKDSNHTKITFHGFTLSYSGVEVIRDTVRTFDPDSAYTLKFLPKEHRKVDGHRFGPVSNLTCTLQKNGDEWVVLENKSDSLTVTNATFHSLKE